jgi:ABC-2 type transport system ATP-binding protein
MTESQTAIQTNNLSKNFWGGFRGKDVLALSDVSLEVNSGEIFGLLGPNGAGKTTMVKVLLGSLRPTSGSASINGHDCSKWQARKKVGFLPENHRFPSYQTGYQMLSHFGGLAGLSRSEIKTRAGNALELVEMAKWRNTKIKKYSKGMMQRLGLAQALLSEPDIIFLDEPTDGVDPIGRREIRNVLMELKKQGKTIFLNSHLLAEVEMICDRVAILDKGKLIKTAKVGNLVETKPYYWVETFHLPDHVATILTSGFDKVLIEENTIKMPLDNARHINAVIDLLRKHEVDIVAIKPLSASLEDSFMQLIKGEGPDEQV